MTAADVPPTSPASPRAVTVHGLHSGASTRSLLGVFGPYRGAIALGAVVLVVTNAFTLVLPRLINEAIQTIEQHPPASTVLGVFGVEHPGIAAIISAIVGAALVGAAFRVWSRVILFNVGRDVERELRSELFAHLATLSPTFYRENTTGDLMSRLTNDLNNIRLMAGFALLNILNASFTFVGTVPFLFGIDAQLALLTLIPFPLVMGAAQLLSKTMYRRVRENQEALGKLTSRLQENLAGQQVVRAFSQEAGEERRFDEVNGEAFGAALRLALVRSVFFPLMGLMSALGIAIALYFGGHAVIEGRVSIGDVVEVNTRLLQLTWPAIAMGFIFSVYQRGKASLDRINELLGKQPDIVDGSTDVELAGGVEASGLTLRYPGQERDALVDLSFAVKPGRVLGVVGRNASGKSTLVRAAARMIPTSTGQLFFDGHDVTTFALGALRRQVAVVTDDGFLFSASLRENLAFGRPDATDDEVAEVVDVTHLGRDVSAFPEGLETMVGERGVTLSGGQKQRVALARALLSRPRVLVLDDSLSAVDAETEAHIVDALRAGRFGAGGAAPTLIVISHRLSAVREADEILVLEEGRCIERGTHDELLARDGRYADLWGREQLLRALRADDEPGAGSADQDAVRALETVESGSGT